MNKLKRKLLIAFTIFFVGILVCLSWSCKQEEIDPIPTPTIEAFSISIVSGENQTGGIEKELASPVIVKVLDQEGNPYKRKDVIFIVTEGSVVPDIAVTDEKGEAEMNWTLGPTIGNQTVIVSAFKGDNTTHLEGSPLTIYASGEKLVPASIEIVSGDKQVAFNSTTLTEPVIVKIKDQYGHILEDEIVNYSVNEGSLSTSSSLTNNEGNASVEWTLGSTIGSQTLTITAFKDDLTTHLQNSPLTITAKSAPLTVTDQDANEYPVIQIGNQIWMGENLKTTKFNDNNAIPLVTDDTEWSNLISPAYCWYDNDEVSNSQTYGALYNWYTINTDKLCPDGWHIPTLAEWTVLLDYLGGEGVAGGKLKEFGTIHWESPNFGATNEYNFTALPGGYRYFAGDFVDKGFGAYWYTATEKDDVIAYGKNVSYLEPDIKTTIFEKKDGQSVRCVMD